MTLDATSADADDVSSDADLISAVRKGDSAAYGELFERHRAAAYRLARQLVRGPDADDLVSEAFTKVLVTMQKGGGPNESFRAYLLTSIRRLHVDRIRSVTRERPTDDTYELDGRVEFVDTTQLGFERTTTAEAYSSLPERWQMVLWHLDVEGQKPADIAPLLGMSANSVSALAYRAREGLRQAYLQKHLRPATDPACAATIAQLGAHVRGGLSRRDGAKVDAHLDTCRSCLGLFTELQEFNQGMAGILAPALLGTAAGGYLQSLAASGGLGGLAAAGRSQSSSASGTASSTASTATTGAGAAGAASGSVVGSASGMAGISGLVGAVGPGGVVAGVAGFAIVASAAVVVAINVAAKPELTAAPEGPGTISPTALPFDSETDDPEDDSPVVNATDPASIATDDSEPTSEPTDEPTQGPTEAPTTVPTTVPTVTPTGPTTVPTVTPTEPTVAPTGPTTAPTDSPGTLPTDGPFPTEPTTVPTTQPTTQPTTEPTVTPTEPTTAPTTQPTTQPTTEPTVTPTEPTTAPTTEPTAQPTVEPTTEPTTSPTTTPTVTPTTPTVIPTTDPTTTPTVSPNSRVIATPATSLFSVRLRFVVGSAVPNGTVVTTQFTFAGRIEITLATSGWKCSTTPFSPVVTCTSAVHGGKLPELAIYTASFTPSGTFTVIAGDSIQTGRFGSPGALLQVSSSSAR